MSGSVWPDKQVENEYWPVRRGQTDKQEVREIEIFNKTKHSVVKNKLNSSQSHAFTLTQVDLSTSVGHYQTQTSFWGPGPSPPPWLDRLLIDIYRKRSMVQCRKACWVHPVKMKECTRLSCCEIQAYIEMDKGHSGGVWEMTLGMLIKVCH